MNRLEAPPQSDDRVPLAREQAQRLWALDKETCVAVLDVLVENKFLVRGSDGRYKRTTEGAEPAQPFRMAKAEFRNATKTSRIR